MQHSKRIVLGLMLLCLTLFGTACSHVSQVQTVVQKAVPPDSLIADTPHAPEPTDRTNASLAAYAHGERTALDLCNADKAALREWKAKETQ